MSKIPTVFTPIGSVSEKTLNAFSMAKLSTSAILGVKPPNSNASARASTFSMRVATRSTLTRFGLVNGLEGLQSPNSPHLMGMEYIAQHHHESEFHVRHRSYRHPFQ